MSRHVTAAAINWWESHRPIGWTEEQHCGNAAVNTCTSREAALAFEVASLISRRAKLKRKP